MKGGGERKERSHHSCSSINLNIYERRFIMSDKKDVEIKVFASRKAYETFDSRDEPKVAEVIRNRILPQSEAEYLRVNVKIKRKSDQTPEYLVAYLLRKDIYSAEVVRVDVDSNYEPTEITFNYDESEDAADEDAEDEEWGEDLPVEESFVEEEKYISEEEDVYTFDFVAATPVPEIPSAKAAVEKLHALATKAGLRSKMLLGKAATVSNYKQYLTSGLKGFVSIGHGNPNVIVLCDGPLNASWFKGLSNNPLKPGVIYFNSCQVFNEPLKSAVMHAGARTYIGGIVNLLIGPSEEVCKCFWDNIMTSPTRMNVVLSQCEKDKYPREGAHGITGDTGPFSIEKLRLAHAMWTHGHGVQIEYPDRLALERRYGFFIRLRGKPFTSNWVHFEVPTPVIVDGQRLRVGSVMVRFRTGSGASVHAVHVWDGERRIATYNGLNLSSRVFRTPRFGVPNHPYIRRGLGISFGVKFGDSANLPKNKLLVDISSAGCDFIVKT
jgi:hypothetical protein